MPKIAKTKDYDLRRYVVQMLLAEGIPREDIRHELTLDTSSTGGRVDLAILRPDAIWAIELKSGLDVLDRLEDQMRGYKRAFDRSLIIADKLHDGDAALRHNAMLYCHRENAFVERNRGIFSRTNEASIRRELEGGWRAARGYATSAVDMLSLLWRDEAVAATRELGTGRQKTRCDAILYMKENYALKDLRPRVISALRARALSKWEVSFWTRFYEGSPQIVMSCEKGFTVGRFMDQNVSHETIIEKTLGGL